MSQNSLWLSVDTYLSTASHFLNYHQQIDTVSVSIYLNVETIQLLE